MDHRTLAVGLAGVVGEMEPARDADGGCGVMCGEQRVFTSERKRQRNPLRVCMVTNPSPKKNQLFLPKTDRVEQYLILKVLIL